MGVKYSRINYLDDPAATLTPSKETLEMVAANVADKLAYKTWRALLAGDPEVTLDVDFGQARPIQCFGCFFPSKRTQRQQFGLVPAIAPDDTIQLILSTTDAHDGDVLDTGPIESGVVQNMGTFVRWFSQIYTARYMRVVFNVPSRLSEGFFDVKRIWAGPVFAPRVGVNYGAKIGSEAANTKQRPQRGTTTYNTEKNPRRVWTYVMGWIDDDTELDQMEDLIQTVDTSGEFLVHRDDLHDGRADMFTMSASVYPISGDNFKKSAISFLLEENI